MGERKRPRQRRAARAQHPVRTGAAVASVGREERRQVLVRAKPLLVRLSEETLIPVGFRGVL